MLLFLSLTSLLLAAEKCSQLRSDFEREEQAYKAVTRIAIASNSAYDIIGKFVDSGTKLLNECPKTYSLDRQYTLRRTLKKARYYRAGFKVFTQDQVAGYAVNHPEQRVVYKWGKVRISP